MPTAHPRRAQVTGNRYSPQVPVGSIWAMREAPGHARSVYANPHAVGTCKKTCRGRTHDLAEALRLYAAYLDEHPEIVRRAATEPDGTRFACRCPLDEPCHVDELLRRVDELRAAV
ncbi:DUF4326 domain-containing protein [Streptomyces flaveus]|uniref:DUF4326 domain-containing protein n=1 Tax=Streptomyces flaveus TaxID=66370 RepID=A0A917QSG2_9ACTN|nr:DUF4326 domain-containing protein [Streptomyces flaveus]GGK65477.1 hypothetical protein GCM10010094_28130 [Streptomyces flaveus]